MDVTIKSKREYKSEALKKVVNIIINVFILITYFIMIAGFGAYLEQEFSVNQIFGSSILAIVTYFVGIGKKDSLVKINQFIIPILIFLIIAITFISFKGSSIEEVRENIPISQNGYVMTSIVYASYNSILLIPILITLGNRIKNRKQILKISIYSVGIILVLAYSIFAMLTKIDIDISALEMPAVYAVSQVSELFKYIYGAILLLAIFTTSISLQTSFLENVIKDNSQNTKKKVIVLLMSIFGILISRVGFANLVNYLYQILGYLGLVQIIKICLVKTKI